MPLDAVTDDGFGRLALMLQVLDQLSTDKSFTFTPQNWLRIEGDVIGGCAVGYAMMKGTFAAHGLIMAESENQGDFVPEYDGLYAFDAVAKFFDISFKEAEDLFFFSICIGTVDELRSKILTMIDERIAA